MDIYERSLSSTGAMPLSPMSLSIPIDSKPMDIDDRWSLMESFRTYYSPWMLKEDKCRVTLLPQGKYNSTLSPAQASELAGVIRAGYVRHLIMDGLPAAHDHTDPARGVTVYNSVPLGAVEQGLGVALHNHLRFTVRYYRVSHVVPKKRPEHRIVHFAAEPRSIDWAAVLAKPPGAHIEANNKTHRHLMPAALCERPEHPPLLIARDSGPTEVDQPVYWTYDVVWVEEPKIRWAARWSLYVHNTGALPDHIVALVLSMGASVALVLLAGLLIMRYIRRDIRAFLASLARRKPIRADADRAAHRDDDAPRDVQPLRSGWQGLDLEVYRPPMCAKLLSASVTTGALLWVLLATVGLALLVRAVPGGADAVPVVFFFGYLAAWTGAGRLMHHIAASMTPHSILDPALANDTPAFLANLKWLVVFYPSIALATLLLINLVLLALRSSGVVPWRDAVTVVVVWAMGALGASVWIPRYDPRAIERLRTLAEQGSEVVLTPLDATPLGPFNPHPRPIPPARGCFRPAVVSFLLSLFLFGSFIFEFAALMDGLWLGRIVFFAGFVVVVGLLLIVVAAGTSLIAVFVGLVQRDPRWAWRSFWVPALGGVYLFLASLAYLVLRWRPASLGAAVVFVLYMGLASLAFALMLGSVGFFLSRAFVRRIYTAIKQE